MIKKTNHGKALNTPENSIHICKGCDGKGAQPVEGIINSHVEEIIDNCTDCGGSGTFNTNID